jgi:mRNA interferase HicA
MLKKKLRIYPLLREGRRHSIYKKGDLKTEIPRHNEIVDELARKICKDLDIPFLRWIR